MQKINYGLIVSDFDGTLVNSDGTIGEYSKNAIAKYREAGGKFAISTGRLPNAIIDRAKELGLKGAVSCCQGSAIVDIETREVLFSGRIPNSVAVKACRKMEEMGLHIHVYDLWDFYCNKDDEPLKYYEFHTGTKANLVLDEPLWKFVERAGFDVFKILIMVDASDAERVMEELKREKYEGCVMTKSGDVLVELINANNSKGTAVKFLSKYYGVPLEKTLGVGDQLNDVYMVKTAGLGVAVKNADERLKAVADYVCEYTNEEGAVGKLIEKFGFAK
ncbi:MAG: HAD family hydrolase [Clostridia bacterium]|nr:HAD family hydrolase [Clostridia bacterium]